MECNVDEILVNIKAVERLRLIQGDLVPGSILHGKLGVMIEETEQECNRLTGECGNLENQGLDISESDDIIVPGESFEPSLIASLLPESE